MTSMRAAAGGILLFTLVAPAAHGQSERSERFRRETIAEATKDLTRDKDPEVRANAALNLGRTKAVEAIPLLTSALRGDASPLVRASAAGALQKLAPDSASAVPALGEALKDAAPEVRANAAGALWKLAPASRVAVPALEKALADASPRVRLNAAGALNMLDAGTPAGLAGALGPVLTDADLAKQAAELLVSLDLENADVRRVVVEGLAHGQTDARMAILEGMSKAQLDNEAVLPYAPALAQAIRADKEVEVRARALTVARPPLPKELSAAVEGALKDESPAVREAAARMLNAVGGEARQRQIEETTARGGGRAGPPDMDAIQRAAAAAPGHTVDRLIGELRTGATEQARSEAAQALSHLSTSADPIADALSKALLAEPSAEVRLSIAMALRMLPGVRDKKATVIAALKAALRDPDSDVRDAAQLALDSVTRYDR